jgi:hypothetical protein
MSRGKQNGEEALARAVQELESSGAGQGWISGVSAMAARIDSKPQEATSENFSGRQNAPSHRPNFAAALRIYLQCRQGDGSYARFLGHVTLASPDVHRDRIFFSDRLGFVVAMWRRLRIRTWYCLRVRTSTTILASRSILLQAEDGSIIWLTCLRAGCRTHGGGRSGGSRPDH